MTDYRNLPSVQGNHSDRIEELEQEVKNLKDRIEHLEGESSDE